jgi:hypothetical protein
MRLGTNKDAIGSFLAIVGVGFAGRADSDVGGVDRLAGVEVTGDGDFGVFIDNDLFGVSVRGGSGGFEVGTLALGPALAPLKATAVEEEVEGRRCITVLTVTLLEEDGAEGSAAPVFWGSTR